MKRLTFLLAIALLLVGCDETGYTYDPADQRAFALETQAAANAKLRSTEEAAMRQAARATQEAATQQAYSVYQMELIESQIKGTQAAFDIESTATVRAYEAESAALNGAILSAKETQMYQATGTPFAATQAALVRQVQKDSVRDWWMGHVVIPVQTLVPTILGVVIISGILLIIYAVLKEARNWFRELMPAVEMKMRMHTAPDGRIIFVLDPKQIGSIFVDPSRMFEPGMIVEQDKLLLSGGAREDLQYGITTNAQRIDAMRVTTPAVMNSIIGNPPVEEPVVEILDDSGDVASWVDEVEVKYLEG